MSNFSWLSAVVGFMVAILFEEVFIRSGHHPVSVQIDPTVLKSIPADAELELLLEVEWFRNQSLVQQTALRDSKQDHEDLILQLSDLQRDFHASIGPEVTHSAVLSEGISKRQLTPECALNVRLAREKACGCEMDACPVLFKGYDCTTAIEKVPECVAPWQPPFNESSRVPFTLSLNSLKAKYGSLATPVLEFGLFPQKEGSSKIHNMTLALDGKVKKLLPNKEVISSSLYRTCALVGSSQDLMQQNLSAIIDNHDLIVRLNGAVVEGYEDHVGTRTHLRFVTSQWLGFREQPTEKVVHLDKESADPLYGCDMETECTTAAATMERYVKNLALKQKVHTHTLHPDVAKWLRTTFNQTYVGQEMEIMGSTGFQAMILMLHVCEKVDLFGFTGSTAQKYFDDTQALALQKELLAKWNQEIYEDMEEANKVYHGKNRRLLSAGGLAAGGGFGDDGAEARDWDGPLGFAWEAGAEGEGEGEGARESRRNLQRRHHKKKGPPPPKKKKHVKKPEIVKEELDLSDGLGIPDSIANGMITGFLVDLDYERRCQQDLVNKGLVTVYGAHVDMRFIEREHKELQDAIANRLDEQETKLIADDISDFNAKHSDNGGQGDSEDTSL